MEEKNCSGSDGNADLCGTDYEAQSDPQTGSPPRDKSTTRAKGTESEFVQQESTERKPKLFRSSASAGKKKHSLSIGMETTNPESVLVRIDEFFDVFILFIYFVKARKSFLEQVNRLLSIEDPGLPDTIVLIQGQEPQVSNLISRLSPLYRIFQPSSTPEVRSVFTTLFNKIHK